MLSIAKVIPILVIAGDIDNGSDWTITVETTKFAHAKFICNGITILTWKNPLQVDHVFVANNEGQCLFSGFVGWIHAEDLQTILQDIKKQYHHL